MTNQIAVGLNGATRSCEQFGHAAVISEVAAGDAVMVAERVDIGGPAAWPLGLHTMTLALRRTVFLDGEQRPDDYEVRHNGRTVGRILRLQARAGWHWT